jgi:hypothetical protein
MGIIVKCTILAGVIANAHLLAGVDVNPLTCVFANAHLPR